MVTRGELFEKLRHVRKSGNGWSALAPCHDDHNNSFSFTEQHDRWLFKCHRGCSIEAIVKALGLEMKDLFRNGIAPPAAPRRPGTQAVPPKKERAAANAAPAKIVARYSYTDEHGRELYRKIRWDPKDFRVEHPDPEHPGKYIFGKGDAPWVPYGLPELLAAPKEQRIHIPDGEKDRNRLKALGLLATCCGNGTMGSWTAEQAKYICAHPITIIADNDQRADQDYGSGPGYEHAQKLAHMLWQLNCPDIRIAHMPRNNQDGESYWLKDVSEYLELLPDPDLSLLAFLEASDAWMPPQDAPSLSIPELAAKFCNSYQDFEDNQVLKFAIENFIQENAVNAIAGLSGHGKSWLALAIAKALLFGPGKLWDLFTVHARAERVLYIVPEVGLAPMGHRLKKMQLYDELRTGRLLVRTMQKGPTPKLDDSDLLGLAHDSHIILDTAVRFMLEMKDENSASDAARHLSEDFFNLLRVAGAKSIIALFHSPKSFAEADTMELENMVRGSSEFGATFSAAWGVRQIDKQQNLLHIQNLKPRDIVDPVRAFQLLGNPSIDNTGDFTVFKTPNECGLLEDELGAGFHAGNRLKQIRRDENLELVRAWLAEDPDVPIKEMQERFKKLGKDIAERTLKRYKTSAIKEVK